MTWLINATQADKFRKSQKSLIIFDASLHLPATGRQAKEEFDKKHIIGAHFFDIHSFNHDQDCFTHKLNLDPAFISERLGRLGIKNDFKIIFYDNSELHSAFRAAWMMKLFGHNPHLLYILDGGLAAWEKAQGKTESGSTSATPKKYNAKLQPALLRSLSEIKENLRDPHEQIVDLRHAARFAGLKEARPEMRSGHIPGSFSLPYNALFEKNGCLKTQEKLRSLFLSMGIDLKSPIIAACGSSITATILDFCLDWIGHKNHTVYEGSWREWGAEKLYSGESSLEERPVVTCLEADCPENLSD